MTPNENPSPPKNLKIISWNVNGIRACIKKGLRDFIAEQKPDVLCLQETKALPEQVDEEERSLGFVSNFWRSAQRKGYSGVATFSGLQFKEAKPWEQYEDYDKERRVVITHIHDFILYNIYFPNGGSGQERHFFKQKFLRNLNEHLKAELSEGKKIIVVGDYNVARSSIDVFDPIRLASESGFLPEERSWFDSFLSLGFVDTFRQVHGNVKDRYTWWNYRELARLNNRGWRIDYICVSNNLADRIVNAEIFDKTEGSDHCPIMVELGL